MGVDVGEGASDETTYGGVKVLLLQIGEFLVVAADRIVISKWFYIREYL